VKRQPPSASATDTSPSCRSTRPRTIARPNPPPPVGTTSRSGLRAAAPRKATSKTFGRSDSGMPPHPLRDGDPATNGIAATVDSDDTVTGRVPDRVEQRSRCHHRIGDHVGQRDVVQRDVQSTGVDPGELEQVVDQSGDTVGLGAHSPVVVRHRRGVVDDSVFERFRHCPQPGQRSARVVRDPRHELSAALLQSAFPFPGLGGPDAGAGQPAAGPQRHSEAHGSSRDEDDEQHAEVVFGDEHRLGDGDHPRHHASTVMASNTTMCAVTVRPCGENGLVM
jgi:hypothetical protein